MPVNPNTVSQTSTPSALVTATLQAQQNDREGRIIFTGSGSITGTLKGSVDGVTFVTLGAQSDLDGSPLPPAVTTFPSSYWVDFAGWNYLQFVPTGVTGSGVTVQLLSAVNLGGRPVGSALFYQQQALILAMSDMNSTDYLAAVGGSF